MRILYIQTPKPIIPLNEACFCLTPKIYAPDTKTLYLDISGTENLLGGESKILQTLSHLLHTFETQSQTVLTDRPEWAKMFCENKESLIPRGESYASLLRLPLERLEYCGDPREIDIQKDRQNLIAFMRRVGMRQISDFVKLTATAINRRFGKQGIELFEWLSGKKTLCLPPLTLSPTLKARIDTDDVTSLEGLLFYLRKVFIQLEAQLHGRGLLAKQIKFFFHVDSGNEIQQILNLSTPKKEATELLKLAWEFCQKIQWDSPLHSLTLEILEAIPHTPGQLSLWDETENKKQDLLEYLTRLKQRFKEVGFAELQTSYLPDRAWALTETPTPVSEAPPSQSHRPAFLYHPPKPCCPPTDWDLIPTEKLLTEWWETGGHREYFIANTPQGKRLWVYQDLESGKWFLHGSF